MPRWLFRLGERFLLPSRSRYTVAWVWLILFLLAFSFYAAQVARRDGLRSPPRTEDAVEYDCIAVQISKGNGVALDYSDPDFQAPYQAAGHRDLYRVPLASAGRGPTTFRPPGLPMLMAGIYQSVGRRFDVIRLLNCAAMAAAISIALLFAYRIGGLVAAAVGLICATVVDSARPYIYGDILTEPLAALSIVALFWFQLSYARSPTLRRAATVGIVLGAATLVRTAFVLWFPILLLAMLVPFTSPLAGLSWRARFTGFAVAVIATAACVAPWGIRNILLLKDFKPLGLHGEMNFAVAYSDRALRNGGLWFNPASEPGTADDRLPSLAFRREQLLAERSRRDAMEWLSDHWQSVPQLMLARVWTAWRPTSRREILLLMLCGFGLAVYPDRDERRLIAWFVLAATVAIALSWSVGGRFTVPVRPLLYATAGVGVAALGHQLLGIRQNTSTPQTPPRVL